MLVSVLAAPMPGDAETARFKAAFARGEAQFQAGDWGAAIANFLEADRMRVTPEVAWDLAKCFEKLNDAPYAVFYYRLYLRRSPNAPDTLEVAQRVGTVLQKLERENLGALELEAPRASSVTIKNRRYPAPPVALFLPPGEYEVSAEFPAGKKTMAVQVRLGKTTAVTFEPLPPPMVNVEQAPRLAATEIEKSVTPADTTPVRPLRIASYVTFGVGVAALAGAVALGVSSAADATTAQNKSLTYSAAARAADDANSKAIGADVLYGLGGAAASAGVLMFVFSLPEPGMKAEASR